MEQRRGNSVVQALLPRCRLGEAAAWQEFCGLFQKRLERLARQDLREHGLPADLAPDMVQNGLLSLWQNHGEKLADYDPRRADFCTFLHHVVRGQVCAEAHRQHPRTLSPEQADLIPSLREDGSEAWLADFLATLSLADREFVAVYLLGDAPPAVSALPVTLNPANWKHKITVKLACYLAARKAPPARKRVVPPARSLPAGFESTGAGSAAVFGREAHGSFVYDGLGHVDLFAAAGHLVTVVYNSVRGQLFVDCIGVQTTYTYSTALAPTLDLAFLNAIVTTVYAPTPRLDPSPGNRSNPRRASGSGTY